MRNLKKKTKFMPQKITHFHPPPPLPPGRPTRKYMVRPKVSLYWALVAAGGFHCCPSLPIFFFFCFGVEAWKEIPGDTGVDCCILVGFRRFQRFQGLTDSASSNEIIELEVLLCLYYRVRTCLWWRRIPSSKQNRSLKWWTMYITKWVIAKKLFSFG